MSNFYDLETKLENCLVDVISERENCLQKIQKPRAFQIIGPKKRKL